jgi:outer membrane protein assembly factor BamB
MINDPRLRTPEDELARRLGRYVDALVADQGPPPDAASEIADLAAIARALTDAPIEPAPEAVHARAQAWLGANQRLTEIITASEHDLAPASIRPNGRVPRAASIAAPVPERAPTPLRRVLSVVELAAVAAVILFLFYVYVTVIRDRQAEQPTPTPVATATAAPTPTAVAPTPTVSAGAVGDWPMLGGGPTHAGGAGRALPAVAPVQRWKAALPAGIRFPVAAGDAVYVSNGGVIVAVDAATGAERWRFDLEVAPSVAGANPPAVVGGTVYAAAHDGTVVALDAVTGVARWSHETNGTVTTAVAVAGGFVFVGTTEGVLYALDAATGADRWSASTGPISLSSPAVTGDTVFVGGGGNTLYALEVATGAVRWNQAVKAGMQSVAVGGDLAVASGINTSNSVLLVALDAKSGDARWQGQTIAELPPAIVGNTVFVAGGTTVTALDGAHGSRIWNVDARLHIVDFAVAGDALLVCRKDGALIAVDATSGEERWRIANSGTATGVAVGSGVVYVAWRDGTLAAFS